MRYLIVFFMSFVLLSDILAENSLEIDYDQLEHTRLVSTFSIVARDSIAGELGVAVASRFFAVGSVVPWAKADQQFYFLKSQIVVFDTGMRFDYPDQLLPHILSFSTGSIYYHFIDARNRTDERVDDFSSWVTGLNDDYKEL